MRLVQTVTEKDLIIMPEETPTAKNRSLDPGQQKTKIKAGLELIIELNFMQ